MRRVAAHRVAAIAALPVIVSLACAARAGGAPATRRSRAPARNVQIGTLAALDAAASTITLRTPADVRVTYRCTEKTRYWRDKRTAALADFKVGDGVVVRFRLGATAPASLYDLADRASWDWLDRLRHEITGVTVVAVTSNSLRATEGPGGPPVEYRVTAKTQWLRDGRATDSSAFHAGDHAFVVPRMLPSGGVMAAGVADTEAGAEALRNEAKPTVAGTVLVIDLAKRSVRLQPAAGPAREFVLDDGFVVKRGGVEVGLDAMRPGAQATLWLRQNARGERVVGRITLRAGHAKTRIHRISPKRPMNAKRPAG